MDQSRFWLWIGRGAALHELILLALLVPSGFALLVAFATYFLRSPTEAFALGVGVYVVLQPVLALLAVAARWSKSRVPDLTLEPSSGPSDEVRVAVTNHGRDAELRVTGRLIGRTNDSNALRQTVFSLIWLANRQPALMVKSGHTENVLLAEFEILQRQGVIEAMGEMRVIEFKAEGPSAVDTTRWSFYRPYQPVLPAINLELTFHASSYSNALVRTYSLRPAAQYGPLELVPMVAPNQ
jgi:hypothetical protein